jgi:carboxymethylenebutenolidase
MLTNDVELDEPAVWTGPAAVTLPRAELSVFIAIPDQVAWKSAVVVVGESGLLDEPVRSICRELARAGHGAIALDLGSSNLEALATCRSAGGLGARGDAALSALAERVNGAIDALRAQTTVPLSRVAVLGYGLGGIVALLAGNRCHVGLTIAFYAEGPQWLGLNLEAVIDTPRPHAAPFVCLIGAEDPACSPDKLSAIQQRLDSFGMKCSFVIYPRTSGHFCRVDAPEYRPRHADEAWHRVLRMLETQARLRHRIRAKGVPARAVPLTLETKRR